MFEESESSEWGSNHLRVRPTLTTVYVSVRPSHWRRLIKAWKSHMPSQQVLFLLCSSSQFVLENEDPFWWLRLTPVENFAYVDYRIQTGWEIFSSLPHPVLSFSLWVSHQRSLPLHLLLLHSSSFSFSLSLSLLCSPSLCAHSLCLSLSLAFSLSRSIRQMPLPSRSQLGLLVLVFQMISRDELG